VTGTVEIETRYVPVPTVLEARESINSMSFFCTMQSDNRSTPYSFSSDQGSLRMTLLSGHDILAVDRGGKSDPFAVFTLNGDRVYKSQTKKKTLNPEWHEEFMITVVSTFSSTKTE
jgi:Ca2+-dependent lipid-binding protein